MRSFSSEMESPPESVDYFAAGTTEKDQGSKVGQVADEHESLPHHLKRLFLYCSLFPSGYEFSKDELIQLWIAEGFIRERQNQRMEDTASEHFNSLETEGFFLLSRCDFTSVLSTRTGNFLYKVNPIKHSILGDMISSGNYFRAVDGKLDGASEMTRHLSLICEDIDGMTFGILQNFKHLRTLHLLSCRGSSIKHVPRDFCFTLTFLRTLNLSGTLISELPSSIGNVKSLRYIDASHTPISRLPESIDSLHKLQTIKLRGCVHFVQLPKGMKKLTNLRHIDLDIIRQLDSMPAHLGNLRNLQTLPAFLVGRDDGCHVGELKNLNDLKGAFNISRLENVLSKKEAGDAALMDKKGIHSLELRWSNLFVEYAEQQEIVLECLQPHSGLKELQIQQYSGSVLPTWISNPAFTDLVVITLYRCRNCKLLPCMGQLPALESLSIIEVNEVKEINHQFFRNGPVDHSFPKLQRLEVDIMLNLKEWKDVQMGDLPSLVKLTVDSCPELVTIPPLACLKFLKHLEFRRCPKLMSLPADGLPTSLESFLILDCLELKQWCLKSEHWSMLCHLPSIWFDNDERKDKREEEEEEEEEERGIMAVVENLENAGVELGKTVGSASANRNPETATEQASAAAVASNEQDQSSAKHGPFRHRIEAAIQQQQQNQYAMVNGNNQNGGQLSFDQVVHHHQRSNGKMNGGGDHDDDVGDSFNRDMRELSELLAKLNPMAEAFVPPSHANNQSALMMQNDNRIGQINGGFPGRRGKRRMNSRTSLAQREDRIRRTVYVSDIDQQVTEEQLAALFVTCGQVVDCRICGDPNSVLRFAFIEFTDEEGARAALSLAGTMLGFYPVRVLPSKTAIAPVNPTFLPRTEDERERCARTIYCTNIDKKVSQADVKVFFESVCGEVYRLRLLGDYHHSTRIAFVEFVMAESAIAALNCSGVVLGSLPIRVSPSKTPVRPREGSTVLPSTNTSPDPTVQNLRGGPRIQRRVPIH